MDDRRLVAGAVNGPSGRGADAAPARPARRTIPTSRHGAITRDLIRFASYQLWAEQVRSEWQPEEPEFRPAAEVLRR